VYENYARPKEIGSCKTRMLFLEIDSSGICFNAADCSISRYYWKLSSMTNVPLCVAREKKETETFLFTLTIRERNVESSFT